MIASLKQVISLEQLDSLFDDSFQRPVVLLKHSNTCGISADIKYQLRQIRGDIYIIVVQQYRDVSDEIARRLGHRHQSPQAFVIVGGKPVYHATHYGIDPVKINALLGSSSLILPTA